MVVAGFVGGGFMAQVHTRAARAAGASLAGVVSSTPERSHRACQSLGIERSFDSLDDMLTEPSIDVVHILTPNALHADQALATIAAGKHVVCEKPLGISSEQAERMSAAAAVADVVATVPFAYRFHPMVREARARVQAGELGRLFSVQGTYLQDWLLDAGDDNWRVDAELGGESRAFGDVGSHLVDLVEFMTGDRISRVAATARTFFDTRGTNHQVSTEDADAVVFELVGGAMGTLLVSQVAAGHKNGPSVEISGSSESIRFEQENPDTLWIGRRDANLIVPRDSAHLRPDAARLSLVPSGHPQGYQDAFNAFVADTYAAIDGAAPDGLPRFADGLRASRVTDAVLHAAHSGEWVEIKGDVA